MRRTMRVSALLVGILCWAAIAAAQRLEPAHSALIEMFAARFPPPGHNEDALRDHWTPHLIEQLVCEFPSDGFGWKRASNGRPLSSDAIARRLGGRLYAYDVILSAGTPGWRLASNAGALDISDQVFVSMSCVDRLGDDGPPPSTDPPPTTPPVTAPTDLGPVLAEIRATQELHRQNLTALLSLAQVLSALQTAIEEIKAHDLVSANEQRVTRAELAAALEKVRAQIAGGIRVRF